MLQPALNRTMGNSNTRCDHPGEDVTGCGVSCADGCRTFDLNLNTFQKTNEYPFNVPM